MAGLLQRFSRLSQSAREEEQAETRTRCVNVGATPIGSAPQRAVVEVSGIVRNLTMPAREKVPALAVELYDGTGALMVVWLGRRQIAGIHPGVHLRVHGRVCHRQGRPTMFNPSYEIVPRLDGVERD